MNRPTELVPIDEITISDRLREDYGDIAGLAESIATHGLIHPLTIDDDNTLIAGERRLRAMKSLGFIEVECRRWDGLTDTERRELELEENLRRKDLTAYERSKNVVELAIVAEEVDREIGEVTRSDSEQVSKRGPAQTPGSIRRTAERIGVPTTSIHQAKKHVAAADAYPFLQQPGWKQYRAMEAAEALDKLPEDDRAVVVKMIDEPGTSPETAIKMIHNIAQKPEQERREIVTLATSDDERHRSLAKTKAVELPPMPDPRRALLKDAATAIRKAIRMFPNDPEVSDLESICQQIVTVSDSMKERSTHDRDSLNAAD